ncbi:MAG: tetratricopeptide repeat protein [Helicobacteraceae bacterium]|jgi:TPR repeat protein|nr:tetratricopeptide repeat protein [Helicobacteraceae bacterium]
MTVNPFIISLFIALFFSACQPSPNIPLSPELDQYALVKENCEALRTTPGIYVPDALDKECRTFLQRLYKSNALDYKLEQFRNDNRDQNVNLMSEYILLQTEAYRQHRKTELDYQALTDLLNSLSLEAIARNEQADVELTLTFPETTFTQKHYYYYRSFSPQYDNNPQYLAFEKSYIKELIEQGLIYLSQNDKNSALKLFKTAASLNSAQAEYLAGVIYEAKHIDKAIKWHTKAKEHGIKSSRINLARLYTRKHALKEAQELYIEAAEDGDAYAQYLLYKEYDNTTNTKTKKTAKEWLKKSAENGYPPAEYAYGEQLLQEKKRAAAKEWLLKAKEHSMSAANATLGMLFYNDKQYKDALEFLEAADSSDAKYRLGTMYEQGLGVEIDYYTAYMYYKQAVKLGRKNVKQDVERLSKLKTGKEKAHYHAARRKEEQLQKEFVQRFGEDPILRNIRTQAMKIHLTGIVFLPLKNEQGFIVQSEDGKLFYVIDLDHKANIKQYQSVDLTTEATGNAITVSDENGLTVDIYQFYFQEFCQQ